MATYLANTEPQFFEELIADLIAQWQHWQKTIVQPLTPTPEDWLDNIQKKPA
jgi:hypothetical protein